MAAVQAGFAVATFWTLLLNGIVGFQLIEDGTLLSTLSVFGSGGIVTIITAVFGADAGLGLTSLFVPEDPSNPKSLAMWILYFIVPAACLGGYLILQTIMVLRLLGTRRPLIMLLLALVAFALAQVFYIVVSNPICAGTNAMVDGSFAATVLTGVAVVFLFRYWDSITEGGLLKELEIIYLLK